MATLDNQVSVSPIQLPVSNMYANGQMIVYADGTGKLKRDFIEYVPNEEDDYHTIKFGDRLTSIAYFYYKNKVQLPQHWWWVIAEANRSIIRVPMDLSLYVGIEIVVPDILKFTLTNS